MLDRIFGARRNPYYGYDEQRDERRPATPMEKFLTWLFIIGVFVVIGLAIGGVFNKDDKPDSFDNKIISPGVGYYQNK